MTDAPRPSDDALDSSGSTLLPREDGRPSLYDRLVARIATDSRFARLYSWLAPALVTLLAGVLRFVNLAHPHDAMNQFDETYYVKDGWTLTQLGYEAAWPEGANEQFLAGATDVFLTDPSFVIHPPLGKWIIGVGMLLFGSDNGFGWRFTTALLGTATVLVLMLLARRMTRSTTFAVVAGLLMAVDSLAISMSRLALLDMTLTFFVLLAFLFVVVDRTRTMERITHFAALCDDASPPAWGPMLWNRPWIIAAGATLGAATAVKWSGAWVLAGVGIYLVVTDALARRHAGVLFWPTDAVRQGVATFTLLVPVAFGVYLASWTGWLVTDGGYNRHAADASPAEGVWSWVPLPLQSLWLDHVAMYNSAAGISSPHAYASPAWQWPLLLRPTSMYYHQDAFGEDGCEVANGCAQAVLSTPNPLVWYAGVLAVLYLIYRFIVKRQWQDALVLSALAMTYVPWLFYTDRTIFQFYTVLMLPFVLIALTTALRDIKGPPDADRYRRLTGQRLVWVFLWVSLAVAAFWYPLATAMSVPYDFWRLHTDAFFDWV
ncbi:dolichyl-phosphate-mannose--protein mannosyltransferase [Microbacterium sp. C7(2022)]|uniref:dolichyl-phosphate-mannose--protein mannosyltransferase n=1 Tax=Microbacterium sp. C7(2022) TaxID=2992759 RepID=UPI00237AAEB0|nr:phospholipid carrier-dependent glycosyltransferase [Microbacterium sp. C7(2022)]MDE0545839.1 phospholipid carrier-dependent glycosyltransferase [Microbacterium sp. C7(2022)]